MAIFGQFAFLGGLYIEGFILARRIQYKSFSKYALFYAYIISLLANSLSSLTVYISASLFVRVYGPMQFIAAVLGCGVIFEIIRHVFAGYVILGRFSKKVAVIVFGMIFFEISLVGILAPHWNFASYAAQLETWLGLAQTIGLISIIALTARYGIEVGRNMKG